MKRLLVTDTHLGLYSDADAWLDIVLSFYKDIVKYCFKREIKQIIHLGDFFDNRKSLNTKTQHQAHRIAKVLGFQDLHTYIIVGNHDCYYKNQIHPNTLELFKEYDHITVIDKPTKLDDILLVPWGQPDVDSQGAKYCMGHFDINGFYMNDSYKCKSGFDRSVFKDFDLTLSGHFHTPSSNHNIRYLGAPYGQTFHDADGIRGFHVFDEGKIEFIEYTKAPKFVKIKTTAEPLDPDKIEGNIVRIIFTDDFGTTRNQEIIDNILEHKPFLYSVNYANIESEEGETDDEVKIMDSKEQIVNSYIDANAFPTNINIATLKAMFIKLMKEAGQGESKIRSADGTKIECMSIGFQNFLSFGSKWQDVDLYNGVNFVTGIDMDKGKSNGAGKSSFLETIPFALFGKTARDINQTQIPNWKNKKKCQVVFRFKIDNVTYEIKRGLKPNILEIYKDGTLIDQDAHKTDYQSMFEEIFGMDVKMFMSLIHSNVNNSANIMSMKKGDKRVFLERMFGLEIYSAMNKLCNEKLRGLENREYKIKTDIESMTEKVDSCTRLKIKFQLEIKSKQEIIEKVDEIEEDLLVLIEKNPNLETEVEEIQNEIRKKETDFQKITLQFETWKAKLDAELKHLEKEIKQIEDLEEQRKKNTEVQARIDEIEKKTGKIKDIKEKIAEEDAKITKLSEDIQTKNEDIFFVEKELVELRTNLKTVEKNLELLAEGKCPVCGQDVTDPKTHYKKEITSYKKKITAREKKVTKLNNEKSSLEAAKKDLELIKNSLTKAMDRLYRLENQLKEAGSEEKADELRDDKNQKVEKIQEALNLYNEKKEKNTNEVSALKNKLSDLDEDLRRLNAKQKEYDLAESEAKSEKKHIKSLEGMIKEQDDEIVKIKGEMKGLHETGLKLKNISDYLNAIKSILKDENIKQYTIKQIMPFLNRQVNHYLSEVNYGFYVKIDKWLDVDIKGPGIRNASYDNLSGGERRGIDIALQLSMLDIARTQAGIFPDLLVFDELLDSSIDARGIHELMKIVRVKQKEFDGKIFIISHRDEIDNDMVDNQYKVVKKNGFSEVTC